MRFVRPDVAIVQVDGHLWNVSAPEATSRSTSLVTVWIKENGVWGVAYQRTAAAVPAESTHYP